MHPFDSNDDMDEDEVNVDDNPIERVSSISNDDDNSSPLATLGCLAAAHERVLVTQCDKLSDGNEGITQCNKLFEGNEGGAVQDIRG